MSSRLFFKQLLGKVVNLVVKYSKEATAERYVSDELILAALHDDKMLSALHDPLAVVNFLRDCIEPVAFSVREIKGKEELNSVESKRFATLLFALQSGLPPVDFCLAKDIGLVADRYRSLFSPLEYSRWAGDTALHFSVSSSFGKKGRLLYNIVRLSRSQECLELGTAYGLSALFITGGMRALSGTGHLTTIELGEHQFALSAMMLKEKCGGSVTCIHGSVQEQLARIVTRLPKLDFVFHDAGHTMEDYTMDFNAFVGSLKQGAMVLIDDINWEDRQWSTGPTRAYEGWLKVVSHPQVKRAVEINHELGLLLISSI